MRRAASLFTLIPVGSYADVTRADARRAIAWFPWLGLVIGLVSGLLAAGIGWIRPELTPLAAALAVGTWALVTGGMHLDGLADTADGLGSRRPAAEALAIMKRSDIGPMGVAALVFVIVVDVAAASAVPADYLPLVVALAPAVGRAASLPATRGSIPAARGSGFGALFAGVTPASGLVVGLLAVLALAAAGGAAAGVWATGDGLRPALVLAGAAALALAVAAAWGQALVRRFGGVTGDIIGALFECAQTVFLALAAIAL